MCPKKCAHGNTFVRSLGKKPRDVFRLTTAEDLQSLVADRLDLTEAATLSANAASTKADSFPVETAPSA